MDTRRTAVVTNDAMEMIEKAVKERRERNRALSEAEAFAEVCTDDPNLYGRHRRAVSRGQQTVVAAPVTKAGLSERDRIYAGIQQRAKARAAQAGITEVRAMADIFSEDPDLYQRYRTAKP